MERLALLRLRSWLSLLWLGLLLLAALLLPGRIWTTLLVGLGGLFVVAFLWSWQLAGGLHGRRQLRFGWVAVGDRLSESFTLINDSVLPAFWVEVEDRSNVPGYSPAVVRSVGGRGTLQWRQDAICQQRGRFHLGPWTLHSGDPFGIFTVTINYPISDEIIIHPPILTQLPIPLPAGQASGRVRARQRSWQATVNASTVRDYQPQDPYRWIHWPTSARRDDLYVREFDLDAAGDIWLLLDMQASVQLGSGPQSSEEQMILLAAALTARALHENRAIGLAAYSQNPQLIPPGIGGGQQWRPLRALALANAHGETSLADSLDDLRRVAQRGSAAAILTPRADGDWLPALLQLAHAGIRCHVTLLDRESYGDRASGSKGLCDAVQQLGVPCHLVRQGDIGQPLEEGPRRGFWQFRTLATGKVVVVQRPDE